MYHVTVSSEVERLRKAGNCQIRIESILGEAEGH